MSNHRATSRPKRVRLPMKSRWLHHHHHAPVFYIDTERIYSLAVADLSILSTIFDTHISTIRRSHWNIFFWYDCCLIFSFAFLLVSLLWSVVATIDTKLHRDRTVRDRTQRLYFFSSPLNTKAIQRYCHQLYYLSLGSSFLAMSRSWIASDEAFSRRQIGHPVEMEKRRDNSLGNKPAIIFFWWWWLWLHFGPVGESEQTWTSTTVFFFTEPRPYVTWHNAAVSATSDVCTADIGQSV